MSLIKNFFTPKKQNLLLYLSLIVISFKLLVIIAELTLFNIFNLYAETSDSIYNLYSLLDLLTYILPSIIILYYLKRKKGLKLKFNTSNLQIELIGKILALGFIVHLFWKLIYPPIWNTFFSAHETSFFIITYVPIFISTVLLAPVFEELIFRRYYFSELEKQFNIKNTIIISSVFFSLIHLPNYSSLIPSFMVGAFAGAIYQKTKNISYTIIFHLILNGFYFIEITTNDYFFEYKLGVADFKIWGMVVLGGYCLIHSIKFLKELYIELKTQN